jgi:hypothetical protein
MRRRSYGAGRLSLRACVRLLWRGALQLAGLYGSSARKIGFGLHEHGAKVELWAEFERQKVDRPVPPLNPRDPNLVSFLTSDSPIDPYVRRAIDRSKGDA